MGNKEQTEEKQGISQQMVQRKRYKKEKKKEKNQKMQKNIMVFNLVDCFATPNKSSLKVVEIEEYAIA